MQRVLTVTTHTNIIDKDVKFTEKEYPQLSAYLNEGYKVLKVVPITTASESSYMYAVVFVLEKD